MSKLAPRFSSNRMVEEYVEQMYLPAARALKRRVARKAKLALDLHAWQRSLEEKWSHIRFGELSVDAADGVWEFAVQVALGGLDPHHVEVELYAEGMGDGPPVRIPMERTPRGGGGAWGYLYRGKAPAARPAEHYTPRIVPKHPEALIPTEEWHILWYR